MDSSQQEGQDEGQVQDVKDQAREKAGEAAEQAKQTAQGYAEQAQDRIREQVDQRTTQAGERVGSTAQDIRSVGEALRDQGKEGPAKLADQAADRVEQAGGYLRNSDGDRILDDVENFGRRRPWAVLAGGVLAGIAAARFLKASSRERYSSRELRGTTAGNGSGRELAPGSATTESAEETQLATPAGVR
jgi:hypothetical protein